MVNYFSLGIESRIGMGFDKKRTSSKFCNLCVYFCEGFKKLCCLKTQTISSLVEYIAKDVEGMEVPLYQTSLQINQIPRILGNPVSLVFSNITSFMGGKTHPWRDSKKLGISLLSTPLIPQSSSDSVLEIYAFPSNFKFTMELLCKGNALRIGQERGPLLVKFLKREVCVILGFNNIHEYRWRVL
jgi:diacylglycerol kinase (ATP)